MVSSDWLFSHVGVYIHIPFCLSKCSYCDFNSFSGLERLAPSYVEALRREMAGWAVLGERQMLPKVAQDSGKIRVNTIYIGGGTPTLLSSSALAAILSECQKQFEVERNAEITVEANPGTLDDDLLVGLQSAGVNRLSIGAQSFRPRLLGLLGRIHSPEETVEAVGAAYRAGFRNVNLDLIYGIPTQSMQEWQEDLRLAVDLEPTHLSLYGLSVEEGTPISAKIARGLIDTPDPDRSADMYIWADGMLAGRGFQHYEISNWARPDAACRHNLAYWRNLPYIGIGAGAHSSFCSTRLANNPDPAIYIAELERNPIDKVRDKAAADFAVSARQICAVEQEVTLDRATQMAETTILGLRLVEGIDGGCFRRRFETSIDTVYGYKIDELCCLGLVERRGNAIALTPRGRLLGNEVFVRFLSD